jgi:hypothetical protein
MNRDLKPTSAEKIQTYEKLLTRIDHARRKGHSQDLIRILDRISEWVRAHDTKYGLSSPAQIRKAAYRAFWNLDNF